MRNSFYTFIILLVVATAQAQIPAFEVGFKDSIQSGILNENRQLLIYTPYANQKIASGTKEVYPVLYVLDGENHFRFVAATVERLVTYGACPPMIVVGIVNTNRTRDLTPLAVSGKTDGIQNSGGGEKFLSFLDQELVPYIEANYRAAKFKILLGHSLGGLMAIQALVHYKDFFNSYIAIDAAIWWDDHKILNDVKVALKKDSHNDKTLFLAMANRMEKGVDTIAVQSDVSEKTELIRYNIDLMHFIKKHPQSGLRFKGAYYENENHGTVPFIAAYDALRFIFNYYELPNHAAYSTDNPQLVNLIKRHYDHVSKQLGYTLLPQSSLINNLGYRALHQRQFPVARQLFELNVANFPNDPNLADSMGDYFNAVADIKNAIKWYRQALAIVEIKETREKLNALLK
jgi:predicted alpha/beta superfamily hydrolase